MNQDFFFGAATSAHQVEGGNHNNWTEWEKQNAKRLATAARNKKWEEHLLDQYPSPLQEENYISGRAADHYHRFREDFDIAKSLGHNAHRFSIEWSRIEPEEGRFDEKEIEHYRQVIRELRNRDLEPFVTLFHWTIPVWLARKDGVLNPEFSIYFGSFVTRVVGELGADVKYWITVNEPEVFSSKSYQAGVWPPQKKSTRLGFKSMHALMRAHRAAYRAIKDASPKALVGASLQMSHFESAGGPINHALTWIGERMWNFYFLTFIRSTSDFIGLNFYFHIRVDYWYGKNKNERLSDMAWELYPESLYHVLMRLRLYGLPIYITENGVADARDKHREYFLVEHLRSVKRAMRDGVDVRGYLHWSLLDNFEWDTGFWPRFGLVEVDYRTMERRIRPSALVYKRLIEEWGKEDTPR